MKLLKAYNLYSSLTEFDFIDFFYYTLEKVGEDSWQIKLPENPFRFTTADDLLLTDLEYEAFGHKLTEQLTGMILSTALTHTPDQRRN